MKIGKLAFAAALALAGCRESPPPPDADPALWVLSDADTTVYLFGTLHVMRPGLTWFDDAVRDAFDASDQLVLEVVVPDEATMQQIVRDLGVNADGPSLRDRLDPMLRARLETTLAGYRRPADALDRMDPWLAATMLTALPVARLGYSNEDGAERTLRAAAERDGKHVSPLETPREQLGYFDSLSQPAQMAMLRDTLFTLDSAEPVLRKIANSWAAGDVDQLAGLINDDVDSAPEVAAALLHDRNARWAAWIAERMARPGTVFVAVGAGHLAGPGDLRSMLEERGFRVTRVVY